MIVLFARGGRCSSGSSCCRAGCCGGYVIVALAAPNCLRVSQRTSAATLNCIFHQKKLAAFGAARSGAAPLAASPFSPHPNGHSRPSE